MASKLLTCHFILEKILKQIGNRKKYVNLSKNGKSKSYPVDELLASTFNYAK